MINKQYLLSKLSGFSGNKMLIRKDQDVKDIVSAMLEAHKIYAADYDKISDQFYKGSDKKTARAIFDFLKGNIRYKIESDSNQRIMSPAAILSLSANDCKNYALFIGGILDSLKRKGKIKGEILYRFASYKLLDEIPHHVFVVLQTPAGEIWIDPVLQNFDEKKPYYHKIDRKIMALYSVSGIGASARKIARQEKKAAKKQPIPIKQNVSTLAPAAPAAAPKKKKRIVVKIALAPARGAFSLLVGLNFAGLATKLKAAIARDANKTKNWWEGLGGNMNALLKKIEQGGRKKRLLGIGAAPAAAGAAAAAAAPILVKLAEFLKSIGIDAKELGDAGKKLLASKVKQVVNQQVQRSEARAEQSAMITNEIVETAEAGQDQTTAAIGNNMLPILLAGGVAVFLLTQKKRK